MINRDRLAQLRKIEDERFLALHPKSGEMFKAGQKNMPGGVPMSWMAKWPGAYPVFVSEAKGARFTDVDGNTYIDFCLGDTGSMTGHSPDATVAAIREQAGKGITAMLPTADAAIVSLKFSVHVAIASTISPWSLTSRLRSERFFIFGMRGLMPLMVVSTPIAMNMANAQRTMPTMTYLLAVEIRTH